MVTIRGEHRGKQVEVEFDRAEAVELRDRAQAIVDKFVKKGNERLATKFSKSVDGWNAVIDNPDLLNLVDEFSAERREYLDHVLFSEAGWDAMFR